MILDGSFFLFSLFGDRTRCESLCSSRGPALPAFLAASTLAGRPSHAGGAQSHAGGVAHAGQRLNGLGEVVGEDPAVLAAAPVAAHPGQSGAAHGVVDGLLWRGGGRGERGWGRRETRSVKSALLVVAKATVASTKVLFSFYNLRQSAAGFSF